MNIYFFVFTNSYIYLQISKIFMNIYYKNDKFCIYGRYIGKYYSVVTYVTTSAYWQAHLLIVRSNSVHESPT